MHNSFIKTLYVSIRKHVWERNGRERILIIERGKARKSLRPFLTTSSIVLEVLGRWDQALESGVPGEGRRVETGVWRVHQRRGKKEREREKERKGGWVEERFKHHLTGLWIIVKRPLHDGSLNRMAMWVGRVNHTSKESYIGRIVFARGETTLEIGIDRDFSRRDRDLPLPLKFWSTLLRSHC